MRTASLKSISLVRVSPQFDLCVFWFFVKTPVCWFNGLVLLLSVRYVISVLFFTVCFPFPRSLAESIKSPSPPPLRPDVRDRNMSDVSVCNLSFHVYDVLCPILILTLSVHSQC